MPPGATHPRAEAMTEERDRTVTLPPEALGERAEEVAACHNVCTLQIGQVVANRFRVVAFLGRGGMSEVYEAEDTELSTRVALKILRPELASDRRALERLKREIALARQVTHRGVCRTFDVFYHLHTAPQGAPRELIGLTMELLPGQTLAHWLQERGAIPPAQALPLIRQLAEALGAAHAVGVVHRDFKSGNVILLPDTEAPGGVRAVVTDFGLAHQAADSDSSRPRLTEDNLVVGTADYMAPEQARAKQVTPAVDIYALGVVIFEMVTGQRPHAADTPVAVLLRRLSEEPPSARALRPGLDPRWDAVIRRCLAQDPADRFASAPAVVAALDGRGPVAPRRRLIRMLALGTAAAAMVAATWVAIRFYRPSAAAMLPGPGAVSSQLTSWSGLELDPCFSPDGSFIAFSANRTGRFEIYVIGRAPGSRELQLTTDGAQSFQPAWSPDGRTIAYYSAGKQGIWTVPALGGTARRLTELGSHPAWSPDGSRLVFQSDAAAELSANATSALPPSSLWLLTPGQAPRPLTVPGEPPGGHGAPAWAPDGRRIYFSASDRRSSTIWSIAVDGSDPRLVVGDPLVAHDPTAGQDGRSLYFSAVAEGERNAVRRIGIDPANGRAVGESTVVASIGTASIRRLAISPDGRAMVHAAFATVSNLWSLPLHPDTQEPAGEARALTRGSGRHSRPSFSADGSTIAFDHWLVGTGRDIWAMPAAGGETRQLTFDSHDDSEASWQPDGNGIVFTSDRVDRWSVWQMRLDSGKETLLARLGRDVDVVRLSPDGARLAFQATASDGSVNLWVAAVDGGGRHQITRDRELMGFPCWSPDSRRLAFEMKRGDDAHIMVMPAGGGEPTQLTDTPGKSWPWSWSPDGDKIVFARLLDGLWNLWWVSASTREERQITRSELLNTYLRYPAWSPRGDQVVFEVAETTGDLWLLEASAR